MNKSSIFWISFSDLMTSLFFIMLVLFAVFYVQHDINIRELQAVRDSLEIVNDRLVHDAELLTEIRSVESALGGLDTQLFDFDERNKRYRLTFDVKYPPNMFNISNLTIAERQKLKEAGSNLYHTIDSLIRSNPDVEYLLVVEGNTERYNNNWISMPDDGYTMSYKRALGLFNHWKDIGFDFSSENPAFGRRCEVIIAGSGYFGQSRDPDESKNKRFTIQITSKVGKFLSKK